MSHPAELPSEPIIGASIISELDAPQAERRPQPAPSLPSLETVPTNTKLLQECTEEFDPHLGATPFSPFYTHDSNASVEYLKNEATVTAQRCRSDDLESGPLTSPQKRSMDASGMRTSKLWMQKKRKCDCLSSLTKRQRLLVKLALAILIVGTMIGIAMGITVAVGGGVWKSTDVRGDLGS